MSATAAESTKPLVVRGLSPADIRRQAARRCTPGCQLIEQCVTKRDPTLVEGVIPLFSSAPSSGHAGTKAASASDG